MIKGSDLPTPKDQKRLNDFFSKKLGKKFGLIENFRNFLIELEIIFYENFIFRPGL